MKRQTCKGCGIPRRVGPDFYLTSKGHPREKCKRCVAKDAAAWRAANPDRHRAIFRKANHKVNLLRRFGITVEQYNAFVAQSDGLCGICRQPETRDRRLSLDHDHQTGAIRGFLCSRCNLLLGSAQDNQDRLLAAARYLNDGQEKPIPVILHCPMCRERHIDEGEFATKVHATHACQHCGHTWRPAIQPTIGVWFLPGFKNKEPGEPCLGTV